MKNNLINIQSPQALEYVGAKFTISGRVSLSLFDTEYGGKDYRVSVAYMDLDGRVFMGTAPAIKLFEEASEDNTVRFEIDCELSYMNSGFIEKSYGRITLEISGIDKTDKIYLPLIVKQFESEKTHETDIVKKHTGAGDMIKQYEQDLRDYYKEWREITEKREKEFNQNAQESADGEEEIDNEEILNHTFWISHYGESDEKEELDEKYKDALNWRGPLVTGIAGRLKGFEFRVYSDDHGKHFHVIHKERGIDARFEFPDIQLMNYKNTRNLMGSKQAKAIQEYFKVPEHFKKLEQEFAKRS